MIPFLQQHRGSTTSLLLGKILENHFIPEQVDQLLPDQNDTITDASAD